MTPQKREAEILEAALELREDAETNRRKLLYRRMKDGKLAYVMIPRDTAELIHFWLTHFELTDRSGL